MKISFAALTLSLILIPHAHAQSEFDRREEIQREEFTQSMHAADERDYQHRETLLALSIARVYQIDPSAIEIRPGAGHGPNPTDFYIAQKDIVCREQGFLNASHWITCFDGAGQVVRGVTPEQIKKTFGKEYDRY